MEYEQIQNARSSGGKILVFTLGGIVHSTTNGSTWKTESSRESSSFASINSTEVTMAMRSPVTLSSKRQAPTVNGYKSVHLRKRVAAPQVKTSIQ